MTLLIPEDFSTRSDDWNPIDVIANAMPPRDPDDDDDDDEEEEDDDEDEKEPPVVREPDEDEV